MIFAVLMFVLAVICSLGAFNILNCYWWEWHDWFSVTVYIVGAVACVLIGIHMLVSSV